jgi:Pyridoxamine 5'-phosphate oxidase
VNTDQDLGAAARAIIDSNDYMVLGTADPDGHPWATPVFFAAKDYREFYWVSVPDVTHSLNLAARPELGIVIFDSQQPPGTGSGLYMSAVADQVDESELESALQVYPGRTGAGVRTFSREDVIAPAPYRLYRATASQHYMLCPRETGKPCAPHGRFGDHRIEVYP